MRATDAAIQAATDLKVPVYAWAVDIGVAAALNAEFGTGFVGRDRSEIDMELRVDRTRQLRAIAWHESQSQNNPVLRRRLELQRDIEYLRDLTQRSMFYSPGVHRARLGSDGVTVRSELTCLFLTSGTSEGVHLIREFDFDQARSRYHRLPPCTRQGTGDSAGPEIGVL